MENKECKLELPSKKIVKYLLKNKERSMVGNYPTNFALGHQLSVSVLDCGYWLKDEKLGANLIVDDYCKIHMYNGKKLALVRPIIIDKECVSFILNNHRLSKFDRIIYGHYPQSIVSDKNIRNVLNKKLLENDKELILTNRVYGNNCCEYYCDGKYYVLDTDGYWYNLELISWKYIRKLNILISESALFKNTYYTTDKYHHVNMALYYFSKDMLQEINEETIQKISEIKNVEKETDKEKIKEIIDSNPIYGMLYNKGLIDINNIEIDEENKLILKKK